MGYSKLTYEDYEENKAYWFGEKQFELPLWAEKIADKGYKSVCAIDLYDDIFGQHLEEHRLPADYRSGEYGGIAVERVPADGKKKYIGRRTTITEGNMELYDLIDHSENFCMIAPVSYIGKQRTNKNARYLFALVIEIDDIEPKNGIDELFYSWERDTMPMPKPTYVVCSGSGLHLYFVFEQPLPLFQSMFEKLSETKKYFTTLFWNKYVTNSYDKIQYESVNQPFRCVGTITKSGKAYVMAFQTGNKVTIEYFNKYLPKDKQMTSVYTSSLSLAEAKKLYPEWYQRRIVNKNSRDCWHRHEGIYYNWIEKMKTGAAVGHRYNCLENLCSLAVQCNIAPEQVEKDCRALAQELEKLTVKEDNHFTEYDVLCALRTYHNADDRAYRRRIEHIAKKTGIPLTPNKRNGRKQKTHLKIARFTLSMLNEEQEKGLQGRHDKSEIVLEWRKNHPNGKKVDCIRDTGLTKPTVYKWWDADKT